MKQGAIRLKTLRSTVIRRRGPRVTLTCRLLIVFIQFRLQLLLPKNCYVPNILQSRRRQARAALIFRALCRRSPTVFANR